MAALCTSGEPPLGNPGQNLAWSVCLGKLSINRSSGCRRDRPRGLPAGQVEKAPPLSRWGKSLTFIRQIPAFQAPMGNLPSKLSLVRVLGKTVDQQISRVRDKITSFKKRSGILLFSPHMLHALRRTLFCIPLFSFKNASLFINTLFSLISNGNLSTISLIISLSSFALLAPFKIALSKPGQYSFKKGIKLCLTLFL